MKSWKSISISLGCLSLALSPHAQTYSLKSFSLARSETRGSGGPYALKIEVAQSPSFPEPSATLTLKGGIATSVQESLERGTHPIPTADRLPARQDRSATVSVAKLLTNDRDPDADTLSVMTVDPTSALGGTVSFAAGVVRYTPPTGFSGEDSFRYWVSDGWSAATGTVVVTVARDERGSLNIVSPPRLVGGRFQVSSAGTPGTTYAIQASETPTGPWSTVATLRAPSTGVFEFTDPTPTPPSTRFFRTQEIP